MRRADDTADTDAGDAGNERSLSGARPLRVRSFAGDVQSPVWTHVEVARSAAGRGNSRAERTF